MYGSNLFLFLLFIHLSSVASTFPALPSRYNLRGSTVRSQAAVSQPQEFFDPTLPPLLLPSEPPACSLPLLRHDFAHTYGLPPVSVNYTPPPECPAPWTRVVLDFSASCAGEQYDRIAAVWLDGAELLRTSTAEPTGAGAFWRLRKDVTRYSALLRRTEGGVLSVMLENVVNDVFTGVYHVHVSLDFYLDEGKEKEQVSEALSLGIPLHQSNRRISEEEVANNPVRKKDSRLIRRKDNLRTGFPEVEPSAPNKLVEFLSGEAGKRTMITEKLAPLYQEPADLIIPISSKNGESGFWFRIQNESDVHFKSVKIPANTYRAVLEIYVSSHGSDEFWYSNPPNSYIKKNNLTTGRGNGAFRQVFARIDRYSVGSIVPFPVIFTGGFNPLFWDPIVAIGAFDLPSYSLQLTPFLGRLLDGKPHEFGIGVKDGVDFWLVDANLHLWLDPKSASVEAELVAYQNHVPSVSRRYEFQNLNGSFKIEAKWKAHYSGWVNSSLGNLTTDVSQKHRFTSLVEFKNNGSFEGVTMKVKANIDVLIKDGANATLAQKIYRSKYPLLFVTSSLPKENNSYVSATNLSHALHEKTFVVKNGCGNLFSLVDRQNAHGSMLVQDHSVLSGTAGTQQMYRYRDNGSCYFRKIDALDGMILNDISSGSCALSS